MTTRLDRLPVRVRGLARKVHTGRLVPADLDRVRKLPDSLLNRYEFLRVLAGGNPRVIGTLMDFARHSLQRDLAGETRPSLNGRDRIQRRQRVR